MKKIRKKLEKIEHLYIVKFEVENFQHLRSNTRVNRKDGICCKKSSPGGMGGWMVGWMGGWSELKDVLRIAHSNTKWDGLRAPN